MTEHCIAVVPGQLSPPRLLTLIQRKEPHDGQPADVVSVNTQDGMQFNVETHDCGSATVALAVPEDFRYGSSR